jgi:hypothetical protein
MAPIPPMATVGTLAVLGTLTAAHRLTADPLRVVTARADAPRRLR